MRGSITLQEDLAQLPAPLRTALASIAAAVVDISFLLKDVAGGYTGGKNDFGDQQLEADVQCDEIIFRHLRDSRVVAMACSEERPEPALLGGSGFSVAFDPLDGSSIFGANFAVGSIFGLWPGDDLRGTGRDQVAACYAVYGPRTLLVIARPVVAADGLPPSRTTVVQEFELDPQQRAWRLNRANVRIGERRVFAPANLRAAADNPRYKALVGEWIESQYSLRYSGGMVPDVHHILCKGGGVFCNPESPGAPAKLRLLFECAPLSLIVEAAGGASTAGEKDLLDLAVGDHNQRTTICLGSPLEVQRCKRILWGDSSA